MHRTATFILGSSIALTSLAEKVTPFTVADLKALAGRTLVVEMPTEDEAVGRDLNRPDLAWSYELTAVTHASYSAQIEETVRKNWTFNGSIEFKDRASCRELMKAKSPDHMLLLLVSTAPGFVWTHISVAKPHSLALLRTDSDGFHYDKKGKLVIDQLDLSVPLTADYGDPVKRSMGAINYRPADLDFSLYQLHRYVQWNLGREKVGDFADYVKDEIDRNCGRSRGAEVVAQADCFKDADDAAKADTFIGTPVRFASKEEQCAVYDSGTGERTVLFTYAYGELQGYHFLRRVLIDPQTREIIDGHTWGKMSEPPYYTATEFRALGKCD